jgi:rubrerythrin
LLKTYTFSIKNALAVEDIHYNLYTEALNTVKSGTDLPKEKIFVCSVCGNTVSGNAPDKCPICGVPAEKFNEVV